MGFTTDNMTFSDKGISINVLFKTKEVEQFMKELKAKCDPIFEQIATDIQEAASAAAPVLTPPNDMVVLKESITHKIFGKRAKGMGFRVRTNTRLFNNKEKIGYGAYVEFGNSRQDKKPFLYPAYDKRLARLKDDLTNVL